MADRLEEWEIFIAVATLKSFAAAARSSGRSPQAVTRAVAGVEARVGARLLHRTTRSVSLTSDGERYLELGQRAVAEFARLETPADVDAPLTGTLSVTAPVLFGQLHVLPVAGAFLARHASLDARLTLLDRVVALADEGIDVAVRIGALPDSALRAQVVGAVRTVCVASPAYLKRRPPLRQPADLGEGHECIAFTPTTPIPERWSFGERRVRVRARLVVNTAQAAIDAAVAGAGVARVLSYQVEPRLLAGELRVVLEEHEPAAVPVQLVHLPGLQARAAVAFLAFAVDELRARLGQPRRGSVRQS